MDWILTSPFFYFYLIHNSYTGKSKCQINKQILSNIVM